MATGTAVLDFGSTPAQEAAVTVTGQSTIVSGSHVEAFFMRETTASNGLEEHEEAGVMCPLICGDIVANTSFQITARPIYGFASGTFNVRWVWV